MQGGWGRGYVRTEPSDGDLEVEDEEIDDEGQNERGRGIQRDGSAQIRNDGPPSPPKDNNTEDEEIKMVVDLSPISPSPSLSSTETDSGDESDTSLETASSGFGFMEEGEGLMKIDLEGVEEEDEGEIDVK